MQFSSDNWAGAHPRIAAALAEHAHGFSPPYGEDELSRRVTEKFSEIFERDVAVFFVSTGTAANSLALAALAQPGAVAFCHHEAHVREDECGAPEFFSGGRLCGVGGPLARIAPGELDTAIGRFDAVHSGRPSAVTITQATEAGTLYSLADIEAVSAVAQKHGLPLHMDGARFANALAALDAAPAEMTWKRGVDVLSFGGTKNGCWCAEAVLFFDPARAKDFPYLRKRGAQTFSKARFVAAQFDAYFSGGLWLETARHSNAMAAALAAALRASKNARLAWEPGANEVFAIITAEAARKAREAGASFYDWPAPPDLAATLEPGEGLCRLVTSFATQPADIDRFATAIG
jgi:threonine aldolase